MKLEVLRKLSPVLLCILVGFFLHACGGSGGSTDAGQGTLSTSVTDSSTDEYQAVYVTIARVEVHQDDGGSWEAVANPDKTYNLLELVNGLRETLGIVSLDVGHYTQMRLIIGKAPDQGINIFSTLHPHANYLIDQDDMIHELKVPSGMNTGLKIVNGFNINEDQTTELILDFDAMRSVVKAGSSGKYLLKPTVKVLDTSDSAIVLGTVAEAESEPTVFLAGAYVTAQTVNPASGEAEIIRSGTLTDDNGEYALFLEPALYNLVANQDGYLPACTEVDLASGSPPFGPVDFDLPVATEVMGTVSGTVCISGANEDQHATIDFRQAVDCGSGVDQLVSVKSVNIANTCMLPADYTVELPAGVYQVVASTYGQSSTVTAVTVQSGEETVNNIDF